MTITTDLVGRKARHLHPNLRQMLEDQLMPGGKLPDSFVRRDLPAMVCDVAKAFERLHVREAGGNNHGQTVGFIQAIIGSYTPQGNGDSWCMSTDQCIVAFIEDFLQVESPVPASESCVEVIAAASKVPGLISPACAPGTLWVGQHGSSAHGHTGTVLEAYGSASMLTFEGNTGSQSMSDGDGAFIKVRNQKQNGDLITRAFIFLYPNNNIPGGPR